MFLFFCVFFFFGGGCFCFGLIVRNLIQIWCQFPNSLQARKWSLYKIHLRDWQLLTLQNWTILLLFKQNVFLEQVVGDHHYQVQLCFCLPPDYVSFKFASSQHPVITASRLFLWSPGSRARSLALHKCIYKLLEPVWHEHKAVVPIIWPYLGKLVQIRKHMEAIIQFKLWAASELNALFHRTIVAALDMMRCITSISYAL